MVMPLFIPFIYWPRAKKALSLCFTHNNNKTNHLVNSAQRVTFNCISRDNAIQFTWAIINQRSFFHIAAAIHMQIMDYTCTIHRINGSDGNHPIIVQISSSRVQKTMEMSSVHKQNARAGEMNVFIGLRTSRTEQSKREFGVESTFDSSRSMHSTTTWMYSINESKHAHWSTYWTAVKRVSRLVGLIFVYVLCIRNCNCVLPVRLRLKCRQHKRRIINLFWNAIFAVMLPHAIF